MTSKTVDGPRPTPEPSGLGRFTVTWEHPDDQQKSWVLDRIHFPDPLAPLEFAVLRETFVPALGDAFRAYDAPLLRVEARRINTYYYAMIVEPHVELASRLARGLERVGNGVARRAVRSMGKVMARRVIDKMDGVMARMGEAWSSEWLPEIERHVAFWQGFDLSGAAWPELSAHLEETIARARRIWKIHHLLVLQCAIDAPDDVFMLTLGELRDAASGAHGPGFHAVVAVRRAEMVEFADVAPRPMLGTASGPLPDNPLSRAFDKFLGTPPQPTSDRHVLRGHPGAAGRASGPARVVRSLADAGKLQPGDVLVAETTAPPWTPLFATAAAVVTDTGGILSHCAVVAREYRIPAVVGTAIGTSVIRDGQILEVDGTSGVVRVAAPGAEGAD